MGVIWQTAVRGKAGEAWVTGETGGNRGDFEMSGMKGKWGKSGRKH